MKSPTVPVDIKHRGPKTYSLFCTCVEQARFGQRCLGNLSTVVLRQNLDARLISLLRTRGKAKTMTKPC